MELEGQVVMLRNVKIRKNKDENMEGWMNGDKKYPDKVGIEVCKDAGLRREVRVRKEVYVRAFERQRKEYEAALEEKWKEGEEKRRAERERAEERRREANQNGTYINSLFVVFILALVGLDGVLMKTQW